MPSTIVRYGGYIRESLPFVIQDAIRNDCGDISVPIAQSFTITLPENCDLQLSNELFRDTAAYLRS